MDTLDNSAEYNNIINVKDDNIDSLIQSINQPIVIHFWAPWCGPCRQMNPIIDDIAEELDSKVKIVKVNIDENSKTAKSYRILSIPTLLILDQNNKEISRQVGISNSLHGTILEILDPYIT
ncbi:MAG: thioredoxin [Bacteroidota bacterium]